MRGKTIRLRFKLTACLIGFVCLIGLARGHAAEFIPIPESGTPLASSASKVISGLVEIVSDPQNERVASDLNGQKSKVFYRGWAYFDVPAGSSQPVAQEASDYVALRGGDLHTTGGLTTNDQAVLDEISGLLDSISGRMVPQKERYFHWAAVGEHYALLVGIGDVTWIDLVQGPVPNVHVLARSASGWNLLLSTNVAAFVDVAPPKVRVSELLEPFIARSANVRHPIQQNMDPIVRRGEVVANPIRQGLELYNQEHCWACHRIAGTGGVLGPDLTHIGSRMPSRAWHIQHDKAPRSIFPRSIMPEYDQLSTDDQQALAEFLISLK